MPSSSLPPPPPRRRGGLERGGCADGATTAFASGLPPKETESQQAAKNPLSEELEINVMDNIATQVIKPTNFERTGAAELSRKAHAALDMVHQLISNIQKRKEAHSEDNRRH